MNNPNQPQYARPAYSREEFARAHGIGLTLLHEMIKAGNGPRLMRVGRRVLISMEAAADWRREMEARTAAQAAEAMA